jgi:hypothetical protein
MMVNSVDRIPWIFLIFLTIPMSERERNATVKEDAAQNSDSDLEPVSLSF